MASSHNYNLALEITAQTSKAATAINNLGQKIQGLGYSSGGAAGGLTAGMGTALRIAGTLGGVITGIGTALFTVGRTIWSIFSSAFDLVRDIASTISGIAFSGLKLGLAGIAGIAGAAYGAHKALSPAAEMEKYRTQLGVMGKQGMLPEYTKTAAKTPYSLGEVVSGGILMEAFQISSKEFMGTIIDAASAFNKPIEEIVRIAGFAKSGRTGEALESAARIGITSDDMKALGIKFEKSGGVAKASQDKLFAALMSIMSSRFGGMAEKQSGTYGGKISNLGDAIFQAFAKGLDKALPYAKTVLDSLIGLVESAGAKFAEIDWAGIGASFTSTVGAAAKLIGDIDWAKVGQTVLESAEAASRIVGKLFTSEGRVEIVNAFTEAWGVIKAGWPTIADALVADIGMAFKLGSDWIELKIGVAFDKFTAGLPSMWDLLKMTISDMIFTQINFLRSMLVSIIANLSAALAVVMAPIMKRFGTEEQKKFYGASYSDRVAMMTERMNEGTPGFQTNLGAMMEGGKLNAEIRRQQLENFGFGGQFKTPGVLGKTGAEAFSPLANMATSEGVKKMEQLPEDLREMKILLTDRLAKISTEELQRQMSTMNQHLSVIAAAYNTP